MGNEDDPIASETARWTATTVARALDRAPERKARFETTSGAEIQRLYTPADIAPGGYLETIGFPGEYPFTRGVQPTM